MLSLWVIQLCGSPAFKFNFCHIAVHATVNVRILLLSGQPLLSTAVRGQLTIVPEGDHLIEV